MWLFTKYGFFSAVRHNELADLIHLRARFAGDLERLFAAHNIAAEISHTPGNDYPYRADVFCGAWSKICHDEALAIDYTNFKAAVHDGTARDHAYLEVWAALKNAGG